jgi:transposase InsO family protein
MQKSDPDLGPIYTWVEGGNKPCNKTVSASSPAVRHYILCWGALELKNGILFRKYDKKNGTGSFLQMLVPSCLQKDIMYEMHNGVLAGHLGQKKTREKVLQRYYWYGVREDINLWILQCENCGANKQPSTNPKAPLGSIPVGAPLDRLCTDLLGPFPVTPRKNRYILVVTDHFSKWTEIFAVPDQSAETTARVILNEVIARFGAPLIIHSDKGPNYESKLFIELCKLLEIKKTRTSTRNPKCNGQAERFMKTLTRMIRAYLKNEQTEWDLNLGCLAAAYRATQNDSTKLTPNLVMLGREVRLPAEIAFGSSTCTQEKVSSYGEYVEHLKKRLQKAHQICRENLNNKTKRQKEAYDVNQSFTNYQKGDIVWYLQNPKKENVCPKLVMPYNGPFIIMNKLNNQNFKVQFSKCGKSQIVHHDKLKLYKGNNPPRWIIKVKESM